MKKGKENIQGIHDDEHRKTKQTTKKKKSRGYSKRRQTLEVRNNS